MAFSCFPQSLPVWSLQAQAAFFFLPFPSLLVTAGKACRSLACLGTAGSHKWLSLCCKQPPWPLLPERRAPACTAVGNEGWREGELLIIMLQIGLLQKNAKIMKIKNSFFSQGATEINYFLNKTDFYRELLSPESGNVTCLVLGFCCLPSQFGGWVVTDKNLSQKPSH